VLSFVFRGPRFARIAIILCASYLCLGLYQRSQAHAYAQTLAISRGHHVEGISVRPSFGNIALWRLVYRSGQTYYVDALHTLPFTEDVLYPGSKVSAFTDESAREELLFESQEEQDVERFRFFSQGYLYRLPEQPNIIGDLRYSMFPDSIQPIWGIRLNPNQPHNHVSFEYFRDTDKPHLARLFSMIQGKKVSPVD
jgi:inner membrane protein